MNFSSKLSLCLTTALYLLSSTLIAGSGDEDKKPIHVSPRIQPKVEINERAIERFHPQDFEGVEALDMDVVRGYQASHAAFKGKVRDAFFATHNPAIYPLAQKLDRFLSSVSELSPTHAFTQRLRAELKFHTEMQDISPLWLLGMHMRFAASISNITDDERNLFAHVPNGDLFFGLLENEAWRNSLSSWMSADNYDNQGFEVESGFYSDILAPSAVAKIKDTGKRMLPPTMLFPFVNMGKFGIAFLVKSNLDDIYPVSIPLGKNRAHGVNMSEYAMGAHDLLHNKADLRRYEFISYVLDRAADYVADEEFYETDFQHFLNIYPPFALQKYQYLMGSLKEIYGNMVTKLLPQRGLGDFRKAMSGFFWINHEHPNFISTLYDLNDFDEILDTLTANTHYSSGSFATGEVDSWESPYDPLETSPIDGSTEKDDKTIIRWVLDNMNTSDAQCYKYNSESGVPISENYIASQQVIRTDRFIDVVIEMSDGEILKFAFPTLYHKWTNLDDTIGLLNYGGATIEKPDLTREEDPRFVAMSTLGLAETEIANHVNFFRQVAHFFAHYDPQGEGNSLAQRYHRWYNHVENESYKNL